MAIQSQRITQDNSIEEIVELDRAKKLLRFSDELGEFKELSRADLNKLSERAQTAWQLAKEGFEARKENETEPDIAEWIERVKVGVSKGPARNRLEIFNKKKGWAYRWKRPDERWVAENQFGWKVVQNGPERTLANDTGKGPHVIGNEGSEDLILMERPVEVQEAWEQAQVARNNARAGALQEEYRDKLERGGVRAFDPNDAKDTARVRKGKGSSVVLSGDKE